MAHTILRTNAVPVYAFLSFINTRQSQGELSRQIKILDCGAGGSVPPLAMFSEIGFDSYGIDISEQQIKLARQYCKDNNIRIDLRNADMRQIPFRDESFECVYEHYAMCHLSRQDTATAINEMHRVTKKDGLCFLGVISQDTWPKSLFGAEKQSGEYWAGEERHSMFTDEEADVLVSAWEILSKEKRVIYLREEAGEVSEDAWMALCAGAENGCTEDDWCNRYTQRANMFNYSHIFYILRK